MLATTSFIRRIFLAYLLFPDPVEDAELRTYYFEQSPYLWGFVVAGTVIGTFLKPMSLHVDVFQPETCSVC